jgi:hypothetical protein
VDFTPPPPPPSKSGGSNVNIVNGNLKSENSQDNAQKPQRNCTFMNLASGHFIFLFGKDSCGKKLYLLPKMELSP